MKKNDFIQLTKKLVAIDSISAIKNKKGEWNENIMADAIVSVFKQKNISSEFIYTKDKRKCVVVFKKGKSNKTIVLLAHHDTVGIEDMAGLPAFDIDRMSEIRKDFNYLHARGAGDMKSGIAIAVGLFEKLWKKELSTNLLFISCPDEENDSAGILTAVEYLQQVKKSQHLEFIGAINLDSSMGNPQKPEEKEIIAGGAVGKLLPSFYIVGKATHASAPFEGISSNAIASAIFDAIDSNPKLSEKMYGNEKTPPPTFLKMVDLKDGYNTQLPIKSYMYCNYLTFISSPEDVLKRLIKISKKCLFSLFYAHEQKAKKYYKKADIELPWTNQSTVYSYDEILGNAKKQKGFQKEFGKFIKNLKISEPRERNLRIVDFVAEKAQLPTPYVVVFFSPPFYPSFSDKTSAFVKNVVKSVVSFGKINKIKFAIKPVSEGISDMNYLQIPAKTLKHMKAYEQNNPCYKIEPEINLQAIENISMPVVDIGPHAFFPHHSDEKVEIEYTFEQLPKLLLEVIENLQVI